MQEEDIYTIPGNYTNQWMDGNIPEYWEMLKKIRGKIWLNFLEIGTYEGRTARWFMEHVLTSERSHLTVIDTFEGSEEHASYIHGKVLLDRFKQNLAPFLHRVDIREGDSATKLLELQKEILSDHPTKHTFNLIYIDGSHRPEDVVMDAWLAWPLLRNNGIMVFDDYTWKFQDPVTFEIHGPERGIDKFLRMVNGQYEEIYRLHQIRIRKKVPDQNNNKK